MNSIEIDSQVFAELRKRAVGFNVTPNDVLRKVFNLSIPNQSGSPADQSNKTSADGLLNYLRSTGFQEQRQSVDRFLLILGWLHITHNKLFAEAALRFHRGERKHFGRSEREILEAGKNVSARLIPESSLWVLTTLDNKSKRRLIEDILKMLRHPQAEIDAAIATLPDSGIRRSHTSRFDPSQA